MTNDQVSQETTIQVKRMLLESNLEGLIKDKFIDLDLRNEDHRMTIAVYFAEFLAQNIKNAVEATRIKYQARN
jgi:hypothetical protein